MKLAGFKPDVIVIGGDIVYDDGMRACYYSWANFYRIFEPLYENLGRLVPLVLTVGNHDVGYDALTDNWIDNSTNGIPLLFAYNPQHTPEFESNDSAQAVLGRKAYHYHKLGPTIHFILDSGYINSYEEQVPFVQQIA